MAFDWGKLVAEMAEEWKSRVDGAAWKTAEDLVRQVNPSASGLTVDQLLAGLTLNGLRVDVEGIDDLVHFDALAADLVWSVVERPGDGLLMVVTDSAWRLGVPFFVAGKRLNSFIREHAASFGEPMFAGEVVICDLETKYLVAVHHDGFVLSYRASEN